MINRPTFQEIEARAVLLDLVTDAAAVCYGGQRR